MLKSQHLSSEINTFVDQASRVASRQSLKKNAENARLIQLSAGQHDDYRITTSIQKSDYKQHFSINASIAESAGYRQHNQLDQQDLLFNYQKLYQLS